MSRLKCHCAFIILNALFVGVTCGALLEPPPAAAQTPPSTANNTCDIYASGGTPCVAAHSTVRALFAHYTGRLYQVQRASDGKTLDISVATGSAYAASGSQDAFCAGTTCIITIIYDQTNKHNDLTIAGPGGAASTHDSGAVANALPIQIGGTTVYGLRVTAGVGYRNNATTGVAKGSQPEGMYMVTSSNFVNRSCCFDYGNAEANSDDNGNGHMDAVNFQTACFFGPCSGNGPWVSADLENGLFQGNGSNTGNQSVNYPFVTAMLKNNGTNTFALKSGNAQSGRLTTQYLGTLPTGNRGYIPMSLEGGIILGTGGDNSDWAVGYFFEGVMTAGYPSDATDNAVQASIVAAGYAGYIGNPEPASYTGPSDPGGPGPQDGFGSPAVEQPNDFMGSKPAFASFNGSLYAAFQANDPSHKLFVTSSPSGSNFPTATGYSNILIGSAPAMAVFNSRLYIAFQADDPSHRLFVTSSSSGSNFPTATRYPNIPIGGAPAMAVFNFRLYIAFQANDPTHNLLVTSSSDGVNWPTATQIPNVKIGSDPAMAVFKRRLYVAFKADNPSNEVWIASSSDGINFSWQVLPGLTMGGRSSPALVVSNSILYYIYGAHDLGHEMLVMASTDGTHWLGPAAYLGVQMGATGPGAAEFRNRVLVGFQSNEARNVLFMTSGNSELKSRAHP